MIVMNMKSQGMPITTIVIIIIAVVALVIVALFFFTGFGKGKSSTNIFINIGTNRSAEAKCGSAFLGGCPTATPYCEPSTGECVHSCVGGDANGDMVCGS